MRSPGWKGQGGGILGWTQEPGEGLGVWKRHSHLPNADARGARPGWGPPRAADVRTRFVSQHQDSKVFRGYVSESCPAPQLALGPQAAPLPAQSHSLLNSQMRAVSNDQMTHGQRLQPMCPAPRGLRKLSCDRHSHHQHHPPARLPLPPQDCGQETHPPSIRSLVHKRG